MHHTTLVKLEFHNKTFNHSHY